MQIMYEHEQRTALRDVNNEGRFIVSYIRCAY